MTDLQVTRLCAAAIGVRLGKGDWDGDCYYHDPKDGRCIKWRPLKDDEQAMALVKRLCLRVEFTNHRIWFDDYNPLHWLVSWAEHPEHHIYAIDARNIDLNRAICECAAQVRQWQSRPTTEATSTTTRRA